MAADQARQLEQRFRARGLSRKASRDAVACVRAWLAEQPDAPNAGSSLLEAAHALIRRIQAAR